MHDFQAAQFHGSNASNEFLAESFKKVDYVLTARGNMSRG